MQTRVLTTADGAAWDAYLERLAGADIYHTAEYHAAHEANGDGTALCFIAEEGDNLLLHPFMLSEIPATPYRDIETVYGYSGPVSTPTHPAWTDRAWWRFHDWTLDNNVVAEFIRFNPLTNNQLAMTAFMPTLDRHTVVLGLSGEPGDLWARYSKRHRNMVRKANRVGLWAVEGRRETYAVFQSLYRQTMERNKAADYYLFGQSYFDGLASGLGDRLRLCVVRDGTRLVASALFLCYRDRMHYHLAGSDPDYPGYGDNNLLIHAAALWGQQHGYRWLHLGGGRTNAPDDSLLRFKAGISQERVAFYVGRRIHNPAVYDQLCGEWRLAHPDIDPGAYFLLWRKP